MKYNKKLKWKMTRSIITSLIIISATSAWAQALFDGSSAKATRDSIHAMGKEADGRVRGPTFNLLLAASQKIWKSITPKYLPVEGKPYDPVTADDAQRAEFNRLLSGKTTNEILAIAERLP